MERNFSETLKQLRVDAGYTQKQVYEMIGVPQSTFSSWEVGKSEPSADVLLRLCKIYGVNDIFSAFGYDGYNDDGSICLNMNEIEIIEKYRDLDDHGKEMVDFTLNKEHERSIKNTDKMTESIVYDFKPRNKYMVAEDSCPYGVTAAHERTDIKVTDEMIKHDDDIMDDDNF